MREWGYSLRLAESKDRPKHGRVEISSGFVCPAEVALHTEPAIRILSDRDSVQADWLPFRVGPDWVKQNADVSAGLVWRW